MGMTQSQSTTSSRPTRKTMHEWDVVAVVRSRSKYDKSYEILRHRVSGSVFCPCMGFRFNGRCYHVDAEGLTPPRLTVISQTAAEKTVDVSVTLGGDVFTVTRSVQLGGRRLE